MLNSMYFYNFTMIETSLYLTEMVGEESFLPLLMGLKQPFPFAAFNICRRFIMLAFSCLAHFHSGCRQCLVFNIQAVSSKALFNLFTVV